jgi:hypothetical protein
MMKTDKRLKRRKKWKTVLIILMIPFLIVGGLRLKNTIWTPETNGVDYAKQLSLQTASENLELLTNVEQKRMDISFIDKDGNVVSRLIRLYVPQNVAEPMPLIYIPHYEMTEDSSELRQYLAEGWMVASPTEFDNAYNGKLTDDDLVFNNAALYTLRNMPEVDKERIAIVGGSAGGYMTLMLDTQQMGICASIANSPISNVYFNFYQYFKEGKKINSGKMGTAMLKGIWRALTVPGSPAGQFLNGMTEGLPVPILGMVTDMFLPILNNFPDPEDTARWEAFSPVGLAGCFSSPMVINHFTSDILVPVDQISQEYTYAKNGESMPGGFKTRLDESNPGVLGHSLQEELASKQTTLNHIIVNDPDEDITMTFDAEKLYTFNIYDDGATQAYGSHRATTGAGKVDQMPYLREMMNRTNAKTEVLTNKKLLLLLERYQGKSVQLPAHTGVDDSVYGSLAIYQKEIVEEFSQWADNHSKEELNSSVETAISTLGKDKQSVYTEAWSSIRAQIH